MILNSLNVFTEATLQRAESSDSVRWKKEGVTLSSTGTEPWESRVPWGFQSEDTAQTAAVYELAV